MQRILRFNFLLVAVMALVLLAGCGGDDAKVSSGTDPQALIDKTFSGKKEIKSGKIDLKIGVDISGGDAGISGPIALKLSGPFESVGTGKFPKLGLDAAFEGAGQSIKAGVVSTGDKGFLSLQGTSYVISPPIFSQFKSAYEQAAKDAQADAPKDQSLGTLGIDPRRWLTNAKNAGEAKVGDADTIKLTGDVDISKLLDDVNTALSKAGSLGLGAAGAGVPTKITDEQKAQVEQAVKDLTVEIYTGKADSILRRIVIKLSVADPTGAGSGSAKIDIDLSLLDLNEAQKFVEPANPKPLDELLGSLGGLGGLGGALGGASGGSGGSSGSSGSGTSSDTVQEYTKCVQDAGTDLDKAQKCAELLTP